MKNFALLLLFIAFTSSALADAEITAGDKLFGILDKSIQSKEIKETTNLTARLKYVNIFATGSTIHQNSDTKKNIINNSNPDHKLELEIKSDILMTEVVNEFANKDSQIENIDGVSSVNLEVIHSSDLKDQSLKLSQIKLAETSQVDSQKDLITDRSPESNKLNSKKASIDYITLDSGYFIKNKADNYSYRLFTTEAKRMKSRLFEFGDGKFINDSDKFIRATYYFLNYTIDFMSNSYHEWGHFSRDRALGGTTSVIYSGNCAPVQCNNVVGYKSFFEWALKDISSFGGNAGMQSIGASYSGNASGGNAISALMSGGGLNNDSSLSEQFDEDLFLSEHSSVFNAAWQYHSRSRIRSYGSPGGDISSAVLVYNSTGVTDTLTVNKVQKANSVSILSGSNISSLYSLYGYVMNGATAYSPFMVGDFLVPNQANYFSTRGITRKIQSGYAYAPNTKLVFGMEYVELGQNFNEYNFGVNHNWDSWQAYGKLTVSEKGYLNAEFYLSKKLTQNLKLGAYLAQWDSRSLLGERNSLKLSANTTNQGGLRISYLY